MSEFLDGLRVEELNKYQINKRNWLMEKQDEYNEITIRQYWNMLENNKINVLERALKKDLYDFTHSEILMAINYAPTIQYNIKVSLLSIISIYEVWAIERGFNHVGNPCESISMNDIKVNKVAFKESYIELNDFDNMLNSIEASYSDKMILVLARYGVEIDDMPNLKWEDVDRINYLLNFTNKDGKTLHLPINDLFLYYLDKAKAEEEYKFDSNIERKYLDKNGIERKKFVVKRNCNIFSDYGYILKITDRIKKRQFKADSYSKTMLKNTIRNRAEGIAIRNRTENRKYDRPKIPFYNKSRKYDLLFEILNKNGEVKFDDIKSVISIFETKVTPSRISSLRKNFELLTGIKIQ